MVEQYPVPPSANALYRVARRSVHKSVKYNRWLMRTVPLIRTDFRGVAIPPKTPIAVSVRANIDRRRDLDNIIKPILDCLQVADVIPNDNYVDSIKMSRDSSVKKQYFKIKVGKLV